MAVPDSAPPGDPFPPMHANCMSILELLRSFRAAGGGLIESAVLAAAQLAVGAAGGENGSAGSDGTP
jgi:hypothetical protein